MYLHYLFQIYPEKNTHTHSHVYIYFIYTCICIYRCVDVYKMYVYIQIYTFYISTYILYLAFYFSKLTIFLSLEVSFHYDRGDIGGGNI